VVFLGGGGGIGLGAMGPLAMVGLAVLLALVVVLGLRALGEAVVAAIRRRRGQVHSDKPGRTGR